MQSNLQSKRSNLGRSGWDVAPEYKNVFLTGATGVLGAHLLKELLRNTSARLHCLVRAETPEQGLLRLQSFLRAYDREDELAKAFAERVVPVIGDVSLDCFGLTDSAYAKLATEVDICLHVAASTNLFSNFRRIEPINVGGVRNMIEFTLRTSRRYLCYVSTYTVQGDKTFDPSVVFTEKDLDIGQGFEHMTYQRSKFLGEKLVHEARSRGLIFNIFRPGQIFGESQTGYYPQGQTNVSGLFYDIFKTIAETKVALRSNTHFDVVPVDYVSRSIVYLGLARGTFCETYHLTNPDLKTYSDIVNLVRNQGYDIRFVSEAEYRVMLSDKTLLVDGTYYDSITTKAFKWWFKREGFSFEESSVTDASYTAAVLARVGIQCPKIDRQLMDAYFQTGIRETYFPQPNAPRAPLPQPEVDLKARYKVEPAARSAHEAAIGLSP